MSDAADEISLGGHRMRWTTSGSGAETVVLVHSSGMSSRQWRRLAETLAATHRVVVPDLLGYAESSPWPEGERAHFVLDQLALEALIDRLAAAGGVHLVGHSYGGFLALLVALHRPAAVRSVAAYEPVSFGVLRSTDDHEALATLLPSEATAPYPDTSAELEAWLERFIDYWNGAGGWRALGEPVRESFRRAARKVVGEVRSLGEERTPHGAYATLKMPVLLLGGAGSTLAAKRVLSTLERAIPHARREELGAMGHMGPLTHAAEVNARIVAHLAAAAHHARPRTSSGDA